MGGFYPLLTEKLERALLRRVARRLQATKRHTPRRVLALRYNATLLGLHEITAREAAGGVLGRSVEDLGLRANRGRTRLASLERHAIRPALRKKAAADITRAAATTHGRARGRRSRYTRENGGKRRRSLISSI